MKKSKPSILVVEDEKSLSDALKLNLEIEGYEVSVAETPTDVVSLGSTPPSSVPGTLIQTVSSNAIAISVKIGTVEGELVGYRPGKR